MDESIADSGESDFDMESGVNELSSSLFDSESNEEAASQEASQGTDEAQASQDVEDESSSQEASQEARAVPQSWKKEMHESWGNLAPEVQEYIEQREGQMKEGLEKDRGDSNLGRMMRDVMSPYSQMLGQMKVDEPTMVRNLMNAHYRLSTASPTDKQQLFNQLAQNYGINLGEEQAQVDPAVKQLQDELSTIKSSLNAKDQATLQEARTRVESEVEAFASEHPLFESVSDDLIPFLNAGLSLEDAYDKAIWANPVTREKEMERLSKENETALREKAKQEAEKALKAKSTNVSSRDTAKAPTGPLGSMDDTLRETFRDIQKRS